MNAIEGPMGNNAEPPVHPCPVPSDQRKRGIPVLDARRDGVHLVVWCSYCRRDHLHGVCSGDPDCPTMRTMGREACTCPTGSGDGHRVAHCHDPASPYDETGYILREVQTR
jgi:hypothetical protein